MEEPAIAANLEGVGGPLVRETIPKALVSRAQDIAFGHGLPSAWLSEIAGFESTARRSGPPVHYRDSMGAPREESETCASASSRAWGARPGLACWISGSTSRQP